MASYQALARRYRPQRFDEVLGQEAIVTTIKNSIIQNRLSHAYLFAGSRGTGKTTLARLIARALNCDKRDAEANPCNCCRSCIEIAQGSSMDVLEIDGASHRGIEDVRQLNETIGYATAGGRFKVYIIDEVHMLTKEAFNALLKTLEEPPSAVVFLFATTEPHKVLPTILSRCQQFQLRRLDDAVIAQKLSREAADLGVTIDQEALSLICHLAEGSMRDAESLLDQLISFHGESLTGEIAAEALGVVPRELFFRLDAAAESEDFAQAFQIADELLNRGKNPLHFVEGLAQHYRNRLLIDLKVPLPLSSSELKQYHETAAFERHQCLSLIDELVQAQDSLKSASNQRLALEAILLRVIRFRRRLSLDQLIHRLLELESRIGEKRLTAEVTPREVKPSPPQAPPPAQPVKATPPVPEQVTKNQIVEAPSSPRAPAEVPAKTASETIKQQTRYHTVLRFAAVELEGTLEQGR